MVLIGNEQSRSFNLERKEHIMAQTDIRNEILKDIQNLPSEKLVDLQNYVRNLKEKKVLIGLIR